MSEQDKQDQEPVIPTPASAAESTTAVDDAGNPLPAGGADLAARVAELEAQVKDVQLRAQAEIQNIQKRAERDAESARKFALERFASSLLEVVDNLERALESTSDDNEATRGLMEGVALTHKQLVDALKRFSVEPVDPAGQPFNPELHQAVSMQPVAGVAPNTVTAVLAKGYTLNGRLLRPAMVMVATAG
ncbi:MAG: nucleotide exchange factor GrpE [Moraxellaceae bacterium]|jgi:molecular chaperone GrpE|nr:nucleotide exchange factor GrpE [Moraxellaceae bacterium]